MSSRSLLACALLLAACTPPADDDAPIDASTIVPRSVPSPGCDAPGVADGIIEMPAGFSVPTRRYRVDIPPWWNGTDPIDVLYHFHACGGDENAGLSLNMYIPVANLTDEDAIIVTGESAGTCWDLNPEAEDVEYFARLRAEIESAYCLDLNEVHHNGVSSGAYAAMAFGCRFGATSVFSAAGGMHIQDPEATAFGLYETPLPDPSDCAHPVPVVLIHGRNDATVSMTGRAIPARDRWLLINACEPTPTPFTFGVDLCQGLPQPCSCEVYENCASGAPVVWCEHDGGHTWPPMVRNGTALWMGQWDEPLDWPSGGESSGDGSSTGDATSGDATSGDATSGDATSGDATSGDATSGEESSAGDATGSSDDGTTGGDGSSSDGGSSSGDAGNPSGCGTLLDYDGFDGPGLDLDRWNALTWVDATVAVADGELAIHLPNTAGSRATVRTDVAYDGSDFAATIELASLPAGLLNADIRLEVSDSQWRWVALKTAWGNVQARSNAASYALQPYDATNHRFWRIRFVGGTTYFETSADGETFSIFAQAPTLLTGNLLVTLRAQTAGGAATETVRFDDFAVGTGCGG